MPSRSIAGIIEESTTKYINENKLTNFKFSWQTTASAFSVSKKDVDRVCKYILNQKEHHRKITYTEEYEKFIDFYEKTLHYNAINKVIPVLSQVEIRFYCFANFSTKVITNYKVFTLNCNHTRHIFNPYFFLLRQS